MQQWPVGVVLVSSAFWVKALAYFHQYHWALLFVIYMHHTSILDPPWVPACSFDSISSHQTVQNTNQHHISHESHFSLHVTRPLGNATLTIYHAQTAKWRMTATPPPPPLRRHARPPKSSQITSNHVNHAKSRQVTSNHVKSRQIVRLGRPRTLRLLSACQLALEGAPDDVSPSSLRGNGITGGVLRVGGAPLHLRSGRVGSGRVGPGRPGRAGLARLSSAQLSSTRSRQLSSTRPG